jgi:hypothetical protein
MPKILEGITEQNGVNTVAAFVCTVVTRFFFFFFAKNELAVKAKYKVRLL